MIKHVTICSPSFTPSYSYGRIASAIAEGLLARGIGVNYVTPPEEKVPSEVFTMTPYTIMLGHPTSFNKYGAVVSMGSKIAVTMFESSKLPDGWDAALNDMDGVIVPSQWVKDTFIENGVRKPIDVIPLGVDDAFTFKQRTFNKDTDVFKCLIIGDRGHRKNWMGSGRAFGRAFGIDPCAQLTVKAHNDKLFNANVVDPNVTVLKKDMDDPDMNSLYQDHHVLIFLSRGEGYGWPSLEMLKTGGVVICPSFGGLEISEAFGSLPVKYELVPAWPYDEFKGCGVWSEPDVIQASSILRRVYEHYDKYIANSATNSALISRMLTWDKFVTNTLAFWETL